MKNMFHVTTVLPHNLLQMNPCIRHNFSTQVFRKRAAQLHYVGALRHKVHHVHPLNVLLPQHWDWSSEF